MSQIVPDQKNWTVVLDEVCSQCGYDVRELSVGDVAAQLPVYVEHYLPVLQRAQARIRVDPTRWSDQEYVVHVAEMFDVMRQRLDLMLNQNDPTFPNWDQDAAAEAGNYNALSAEQAGQKLRDAAASYQDALTQIDPDDYQRRGLRSNGSAFTVLSLTRYAWHDVVHHLWDLTGRTV